MTTTSCSPPRDRSAKPRAPSPTPPEEELRDPKPADVGLSTADADDPDLARYFADLQRQPVMTALDETSSARAVERAEVLHWVALLSYLPAAERILPALADDLAASGTVVDAPQLPELLGLLARMRSARHGPTEGHLKAWFQLSADLAAAIRLPDSDREWMAKARTTASEATYEVVPPTRHGQLALCLTAPRAPTAAWRSYQGRIASTFAAQHAAKDRFVRANLRLVVSIAMRFKRGRMPLLDLIQEGNLGLMKAVERFDHTRGFRISTYASWWIRHTISRAIADKGRAVRIPVHMSDAHTKVTRATDHLWTRLGREPTKDEIARAAGLTLAKLRAIEESYVATPVSLDAPASDYDDGQRVVDTIADQGEKTPFEELAASRWRRRLSQALATLSPMEAQILRFRFGMDQGDGDDDGLTLRAIGEKYDLSRERIRQLEALALAHLRRILPDIEDWLVSR